MKSKSFLYVHHNQPGMFIDCPTIATIIGSEIETNFFRFARLIRLRSITSYRPTCSYSVIKIYKYIFATLVIACFT